MIYEKKEQLCLLKNYCTEFMVIVCIRYSSTIQSLIIFNFTFAFKISLILFEFINKFINQNCRHKFQHTRFDILKTKGN